MDSWSIALWVVAGYVAVVALIRLMAHKRTEVLAEFRGEVEKERRPPQGRRQAGQSCRAARRLVHGLPTGPCTRPALLIHPPPA